MNDSLEHVIHDAGLSEVRFVVPGRDLLVPELREHFHPFMFMSIKDVEKCLGYQVGIASRLRGAEHAHARSDAEIGDALDISGAMLRREIVDPVAQKTDVPIQTCSWTEYVGPYLARAHALALEHRAVAETIYAERVRTRPSYASLHAIDPERGLKRTIANNAFYIAEAMYLADNKGTAIVNYEFADTFWRGLENLLAETVWGNWRPFIGMAPIEARQPWGY